MSLSMMYPSLRTAVSIVLRPGVYLSLTSDQWDLYRMEGSDAAAYQMNREIEEAINGAYDREEAISRVEAVLAKFSKYGAYDSEPLSVAHSIIDEAFPN